MKKLLTSWLFTEGRIFVIHWQRNSNFEAELKKIAKQHRDLQHGLIKVQRLLEVYFDPCNPNHMAIPPGKIHHLSNFDGWELWKVEVMVSGLKPGLWPRMWIAIEGDTITLLAINMHNSNYDDGEMTRLATMRYGC